MYDRTAQELHLLTPHMWDASDKKFYYVNTMKRSVDETPYIDRYSLVRTKGNWRLVTMRHWKDGRVWQRSSDDYLCFDYPKDASVMKWLHRDCREVYRFEDTEDENGIMTYRTSTEDLQEALEAVKMMSYI